MTAKVKKIYFTRDFSAENVAKLKADGWMLRAVLNDDKSIEVADIYGGDVPAHYKAYLESLKPKVDRSAEFAELESENSRMKEELAKLNADLLNQLKDNADLQEIIAALKSMPEGLGVINDKPIKTKVDK